MSRDWKIELGEKIREARRAKKKSQDDVSIELRRNFGLRYSRAQISNIEKGKSAAAVNIVSAIAEILETEFVIGGCKIRRHADQPSGQLTVMPQQLSLQFDTEYSFAAASMRLTAMPEDSIAFHAVFTKGRPKPIKTIEAVDEKRASA